MRLVAQLPLVLLLCACAGLPGPWHRDAPSAGGWTTLAPGLEWRSIVADDDAWLQLDMLRIDPRQYRFRAHYSPGEPLSLRGWQAALPDAIAIINANFFNSSFRVQGMLVSDGVAHGRAYTQRGGSFIVAGDRVSVRANRSQPHAPGETAQQAIQGIPLLMAHGAATYHEPSQHRSRRSVIAQDRDGAILLIAAPYFGWTLRDLSAFLAASDLNIETALNLDGGGSTMFSAADNDYALGSFDATPAVLAVYRA